MACPCNQTPCQCSSFPPGYLAGCPGARTTKCDLYRLGDKNVWVERGELPEDASAPGVCMLDTLCDAQVIDILAHDDVARADLLKVTSDPHLIELARTIPRLPDKQEDDATQSAMNRNTAPSSLPFYALFRGQPPFAQ